MIANLFDKNIVKVLALFLISPGSRYIRKEIKEKTGMNNVPLDNALNKLLKLKILKQEKNLLMLNPNEPIEVKGLRNYIMVEYKDKLNSLPLRIYYLLTDISDKLSEISYIKDVYLFGSYAKLIYHEKSDIDLAVVFDKNIKEKDKLKKKIKNIAGKISRKYKKQIEIHFFTEKDMEAKDPLIKDILRNGRKLL